MGGQGIGNCPRKGKNQFGLAGGSFKSFYGDVPTIEIGS